MKKLLTILLSIFVMLGTFTTNVFAENYTQVSDLAAVADMPEYDGDISNDTWTNGTGGYLILADGNFGFITSPFDPMTAVSIFGTGSIVKIDGVDAYKTTEYGDNIVFTLSNDELVKVTVNFSTNPTLGALYNGEYTAPSTNPTIADILNTVDGGFASSNDLSIIPDGAWVNSNDAKIFVNNTSPSSLVVSGCGVAYPLTSVLTLESQNKYKFSNGMAGVVHFTMENDKLISIEIDNTFYANAVGTFTPPKTVGDILEKSENIFPTSEGSGWINNNGKKAYINSTYDILSISFNISLDNIVQKDGNNYKYTSGSQTCTFNMTSDVLTSINLSGAVFPDFNGDYVPYKYEIEPTGSKPQGYTGTLVFKTNAEYTDETKVVVKVNGSPLALNTDYNVAHGSTIVTLLGDYLKNLTPGTYTISIGVTGSYDEITSQFTITGSSPSPTPSPSNNTHLYVIPNTGVE